MNNSLIHVKNRKSRLRLSRGVALTISNDNPTRLTIFELSSSNVKTIPVHLPARGVFFFAVQAVSADFLLTR